MKRILVVITTSMVPYGGLTTVAMNYYRQLNRTMIQMDFASTNELCDSLKEELESNESKYYRLKSRRKSLLAYFVGLSKICKKYDAIHIHANSATASIELLAAKMAGVSQRIVHIHTSKCEHKIVHNTLKPIFDRCYTQAIACSEKAGEWLFPMGKFIVLNNAIDLDKYKYDVYARKKIRDMYGIGDNQYVIGHVGKMSETKNHRFIVTIFANFLKVQSAAKLLLVGDGELRKEIEELVARLGVEEDVIFCGMQNSASYYYSAFDSMVFPSLWEGLPLSLLEAQACGLTCVVSNNVTNEVNMGGVISLSLDDDVNKWIEGLKKACENDRQYTAKRVRHKMVDKGFDVRSNVKMLEDIYTEND